ncbi:hypothetical protein Landi51_12789 [Colletotrichum acutatum]
MLGASVAADSYRRNCTQLRPTPRICTQHAAHNGLSTSAKTLPLPRNEGSMSATLSTVSNDLLTSGNHRVALGRQKFQIDLHSTDARDTTMTTPANA